MTQPNSIQTKITNFNFPSTFPQLKTDPALGDGSVMLFDFSHPAGVTETAGYDAQRLNSTLSQYVDIGNVAGTDIGPNQDFLISLNFWANSIISTGMTLLGEVTNTGSFLQVQPTSGTHGRIAFRMNSPTVTLVLDNEPIRANQFYNLKIQRVSNVITWFLNEQEYAAGGSDFDNSVDINYIGALTTDASAIAAFWDGYIWDVKLQLGTQVGTTNYSLNYSGTGDTPWVNTGTLGATRNGIPKQGTTAAGSTTTNLSRVVIGKDNRADDNTIVNLASVEAAALGVTDAGVNITPTIQPDFGLSTGRGLVLSNAYGTSSSDDTVVRFNKQVSDELIQSQTAGNDYALSFWFKPELDTWDSTAIGYFFRWGNNTGNTDGVPNYNHFILLSKHSVTGVESIKLNPGSLHAWNNYKNVNSGVVNVIVTNTRGYINGSLVNTYGTPVTLQDFQSGNEHHGLFSISTNQHTSDRNITYVYRMHFADTTASGVTEAQWVAKEYATGLQYIKAITDTTT